MALNGNGRVRTLIVDDEELGRRALRTQLASDDEVLIVGEAASVTDARRKIAELKPDLVFLDIELPGGTGIELLHEMSEPAPYVIFVTAHPEFAVAAFALQAVDYLVKPVQAPRLAGSVLRAKQRISETRISGLARQLMGQMHGWSGETAPAARAAPTQYPEQLKLRVRRRLLTLDVGEIVWIQGASQYSRVHSRRGEYLLARTLASLECELDPARFFRIHRSAIVNVSYVREVRSCGDGRYNIHLQGGQTLPMGRARRDILESLLSGIAGKGS
ncbi:MAG TPA: LytTR family DNA-binding domain-containing protein [Steroidobacteraceae bacterium]|nr:LytTR family DNA-binding domain-containing protein [Steroidobacteraceae bacterium]